jgi:hypothetical protein
MEGIFLQSIKERSTYNAIIFYEMPIVACHTQEAPELSDIL